ncbi:MAG: hypothetical protein J5533_02050 [Bacteroidales bacterium]|nr:hypothetical protein [Bacteroidales bacterium]
MKKILILLAAILAFGMSASAQRQNITYATVGVVTDFYDASKIYPGIDAAYGFRNYNRDAFVSFAYGAEGYAYWLPSYGGAALGLYAIPSIGVAIGAKNFKIYPHTGFMAGFNTFQKKFSVGSMSGFALEFGRNAGVDFCAYYLSDYHWTSAINFTWRF